ncbi:hypothetical protein GCM10027610_071260 [Dactylosporangium cerinum]
MTVPDMAIVDIPMPPTHTDEGIQSAQRLRREHPATAVLVLSQYGEAPYAMELLTGGPTHIGYLLKDRVLDRSTLLAAIWRVHAGEVVVDPDLVRSLLETPTMPPTLARRCGTALNAAYVADTQPQAALRAAPDSAVLGDTRSVPILVRLPDPDRCRRA